jgi:hypothetical protein
MVKYIKGFRQELKPAKKHPCDYNPACQRKMPIYRTKYDPNVCHRVVPSCAGLPKFFNF